MEEEGKYFVSSAGHDRNFDRLIHVFAKHNTHVMIYYPESPTEKLSTAKFTQVLVRKKQK